jgi:hypothetical protein
MEDQIKQILERLTKLEEKVFGDPSFTAPRNDDDCNSNGFDFTLNDRPFMKRYAVGLNGQQSFVLICCYLAKGKESVPIGLEQIKKVWENCEGILGYPYRSTFSTRAKDIGWIDAVKDMKATFALRTSWREALIKI